MEKINKKLVNYKKLDAEFRTYFEKFSGTIGSYYEEDIKKCKGFIKKYGEALESIMSMKKINSDEDSFIIIHYMNQMDSLTSEIQDSFSYFNPGSHRFNQEFSTTYLLDTSDMFNKTLALIGQARKANLSYDLELIPDLGAKTLSSFQITSALTFYERVRGYYKKYRSSVSLYAYIVQEIIDVMFAGDKDARVVAFKILNTLEEDKSDALASGMPAAKFVSNNNPALLMFGLVPASRLMSAAEIIQLVFNQTVSAEELDEKKLFDDIGASSKHSIIVCRKITTKPTDYLIRGLLEKVKMSSEVGINEYLVNKLRTIDNLESDKKISYDFSVSIRGISLDKCQSVVILDELLEGKYKVMSSANAHIVPVHEVTEFVEYVKRGVIDKPTRAENYNCVMISRMMNHMFLDRSVNVRQITDKSQVDEIKFLRNDMYNNLIAHYNKIIDSQYSEGRDIKGNKDLVRIVNDPSIKDVFVRTLIENYYEFLKKNDMIKDDSSGSFVFSEVLATFLAQLHVVIRGFVREIFSSSEKNELSSSVYEKPYTLMYADVMDAIDKIVKVSLAKTLSDKSNSYQSLIYKTMILNL